MRKAAAALLSFMTAAPVDAAVRVAPSARIAPGNSASALLLPAAGSGASASSFSPAMALPGAGPAPLTLPAAPANFHSAPNLALPPAANSSVSAGAGAQTSAAAASAGPSISTLRAPTSRAASLPSSLSNNNAAQGAPTTMENNMKPKNTDARPSLDRLAEELNRPSGDRSRTLHSAFDGEGLRPTCCEIEHEPSASASGPSGLAPAGGRLPKTAQPRSYDLNLRLDPDQGTFSGQVKISLDVKAPTDKIVLNSLDLEFSSVFIDGKPVPASAVAVDAKAETVTISLDSKLKKGRHSVDLSYSGKMNELMRGLYRSKVKGPNGDEHWTFTHLEPTHARRVLPSFDEPDFKAPIALTLDVPAHLTPLSNMPAKSEKIAGGRKIVSFEPTPKMSSYLLAVFAARLVSRERKVAGTLVRVWADESQIAQADFALDVAEKSLKYLNRYFGRRYDLPKLDLVAAPDFASGAMENWGAVLFRDVNLLIDPKLSSEAAKRRVAEVVAHEITHQWFGNLVTMTWWNDLWLNEAFATWVAAKVVDDWKPEWKVWEEFDQGKRGPLAIDALPGTRPVRSDAATPAEIQAMFDPITYQKGGALLRMLEAWIGPAAFRKGLAAYTEKFAYKNAEAAALWRELERASGKPVLRVADGWLRQGGAPVVTASIADAAKRKLRLSQVRYSALGKTDATKWAVPVSIRYQLKGEKKTRVARALLDGGILDLDLPGKGELLWAYPNADETGYYRLRFEPELLKRLLKDRAKLTPMERAGLIDQLWAQARSGAIGVDVFLDALGQFKGDRSRLVLEEAASALKTLREELAGETERAALAKFAEAFFAPHAKRLGWTKKRSEPSDDALTRRAVLTALALHAPDSIRTEVDARLKAYLADPASVDPAVAPVVLLAAARRNEKAGFEAFRALMAAPRTPEQKDLMLRVLSEHSSPELLDTVLAMTLTAEVRPQDAWKPYVWLFANPDTRARAWEFAKSHWAEIVAKVGPRGATRIVGAASSLATPEWRREVESFFTRPDNEIEMARKTLAQALEAVDLKLSFAAKQRANLTRWSTRP